MRPTKTQVTRSLADLCESDHTASEIDIDLGHEELSDDIVRAVNEAPDLRLDLLEEARCRLRAGQVPSAYALADRMLGRFICDRLR